MADRKQRILILDVQIKDMKILVQIFSSSEYIEILGSDGDDKL